MRSIITLVCVLLVWSCSCMPLNTNRIDTETSPMTGSCDGWVYDEVAVRGFFVDLFNNKEFVVQMKPIVVKIGFLMKADMDRGREERIRKEMRDQWRDHVRVIFFEEQKRSGVPFAVIKRNLSEFSILGITEKTEEAKRICANLTGNIVGEGFIRSSLPFIHSILKSYSKHTIEKTSASVAPYDEWFYDRAAVRGFYVGLFDNKKFVVQMKPIVDNIVLMTIARLTGEKGRQIRQEMIDQWRDHVRVIFSEEQKRSGVPLAAIERNLADFYVLEYIEKVERIHSLLDVNSQKIADVGFIKISLQYIYSMLRSKLG